MTEYYLKPWEWNTDDPTRPFWGLPGAMGLVDLRLIGQHLAGPTALGYAFAAYENTNADPDARYMGSDLTAVTAQQKTDWEIAFGFSAGTLDSAITLLDCLWDTLTIHADATGVTAPRPLMPCACGTLELHLGGHSALRVEDFDLATHPARDVVLARYQGVYRDHKNAGGVTHRKYLTALMEKYGTQDHAQFIPADSHVRINIPEQSGTVDELSITVYFNNDN